MPPKASRYATSAKHLETGRLAEAIAASWLQDQGMALLERNWRRPQAEIDLVMRDGETCVFVEVRSRTGNEHGDPLESVDARKRAHLVRGARLYIHEVQPADRYFRFDVVGVVFPCDHMAPRIEHIEDAFRVDG
ncbi:MAG: YraN family protein [Deltaproteobacteria bacterium]|nr:YraN family protein [Deltaproteobacteria bacterium]